MKLTIFFSWQLQVNKFYNKDFIQECIGSAVARLEQIPDFKGIQWDLQIGASGVSGSPGVARTITDERIPQCDIFIADLSIVDGFGVMVKKAINFFFKNYRSSQNTNVSIEYGVAMNSRGQSRIISVMNVALGSPETEKENIPFDIREYKWPILYRYDRKSDPEIVRENFITELQEAIRLASIYSLKNNRSRFAPFKVWSDWEKQIVQPTKYIANVKTEELANLVRTAVSGHRQVLRILGLSGLGKSRILFETFRPTDDTGQSLLLTNRLLYFDCNTKLDYKIRAVIEEIVASGLEHIIVLDNCNRSLCSEMVGLIKNKESVVSLITIDNNPEEFELNRLNNVEYYVIKKEYLTDVVEQIIEADFSEIPEENRAKIKEFSQGIPLMAVLLGESAKNGEKFLGRLEDKDLLNNLLGDFAKDEEVKSLLKSSALFKYFGYEEDVEAQFDFIATNQNVTATNNQANVSQNLFRRTVDHYLKRQIYEKQGRYLSMRPFPLAIHLAQEWLLTANAQNLIDLITAIAKLESPHNTTLSEALSDQMIYLGDDEKAIEIIAKITALGSPFDNAEVLNTELGSRLFRAFVEVNPVAVADCLVRNFLTGDLKELSAVKLGRRNLVWVLEKLCFFKDTFFKGAKLMGSFAAAENENWGNNATGQFLHLFTVMLAGTEADLAQRLIVIEWMWAMDLPNFKELAVKAMGRGLSFGSFSRMGGAEKFGTRVLEDFKPNNDQIAEYWTVLSQKLSLIVIEDTQFSGLAEKMLLQSVRGITRAGFAAIILPVIQNIAQMKNFDWEDSLTVLKQTVQYDLHATDQMLHLQVTELISKMTKDDFVSRYMRTVVNHQFEDFRNSSEEVRIDEIDKIAELYFASDLSWEKVMPMFYGQRQYGAHHFGRSLGKRISSDKGKLVSFTQSTVDYLVAQDRNAINLGILGGIYGMLNQEDTEYLKTVVRATPKLNYVLFYLISIGENSYANSAELFDMVRNGTADVDFFDGFSTYGKLDTPFSEVVDFCRRLFEFGDEGYAIAFKLIFSIIYFDEAKKNEAIHILREIILKLGIDKPRLGQMDQYQWTEAVKMVLKSGDQGDFAQQLNHTIISSISWQNSFHLDHNIQELYAIMLRDYFDFVWAEISSALVGIDEGYAKFYGLKHILESSIGGVGREIGVIAEGNMDVIFAWAEENSPIAPSRLAELFPIFGARKGEDNKSTWHPLSKKLIDDFGSVEEVLSNLDSNMNSFSWTGSVIPYLRSQIELMESLLNHKNIEVQQWSKSKIEYLNKQIVFEKNRDEERMLR
ncbi:MAG: hypothetical protein EOO20_06620 [Chryseobacterium sp.]|nr:MAG: hypothetical protein EOO20_06620 [Chryseobacterium sp.]